MRGGFACEVPVREVLFVGDVLLDEAVFVVLEDLSAFDNLGGGVVCLA